MKKVLLGTTALVTAGMLAPGVALAADIMAAPAPAPAPEPIDEGFTLTVTGFMRSAFYVGSSDECDGVGTPAANGHPVECSTAGPPLRWHHQRDTGVSIDSEVIFVIRQTLANGLEVGGRVELEGQNGGDDGDTDIDESYVYIEGHFGEIRLGADDNAFDQMVFYSAGFGAENGHIVFNDPHGYALLGNATGAPGATGGLGGGTFGGDFQMSGSSDSNKIMWFSPRMGGIQLGASYTPDQAPGTPYGTSDNRNIVLNSDNSYGESWSVAANATYTFGETNLGFGGGFAWQSAETGAGTFGDADVWGAGVSISSGGFTVAAEYSNLDNDVIAGNGVNLTGTTSISGKDVWGLSAAYKSGDWTIGGGYAWADADLWDGTSARDDTIKFGVNDNLAAGVDIGVNATIEGAEYSVNVCQQFGTGCDFTGYKVGSYIALSF